MKKKIWIYISDLAISVTKEFFSLRSLFNLVVKIMLIHATQPDQKYLWRL